MSTLYQSVSVTCPNCRQPFTTPVVTLIDAVENPETKSLLLSGQINVAACPHCGHAGMLGTPLVYHDADKELLFAYIPGELGLSESNQQQVIGDITNQLLSSLPSEKRKGYLLQPKTFWRLEGMLESILEADGVTPEMLQAQREKIQLLERLLETTDIDTRKIVAQENEGRIDYEFFQLLSLQIEVSQGQDDGSLEELLNLRRQLLDWTSTGKEMAAREEAISSLGDQVTREGLLEKLVDAALAGHDTKVETMVTVARPAIDYVFYQQLTQQIDTAHQEGQEDKAETLRNLREKILDLTAQVDAEIQRLSNRATQLLQTILDSDEPAQTLRTHLHEIDDVFLNVLAARMADAEKGQRTEEIAKIAQISQALMALVEESQPPEVQLVSKLLGAEYPSGTETLLTEAKDLLSDDLLQIMEAIIAEFQGSGRIEPAERLAKIKEQAEGMI